MKQAKKALFFFGICILTISPLVSAVSCATLLYSCVSPVGSCYSPADMVSNLKNRIQEATSIVENCGESLRIIQGIQGKLDGAWCRFYNNGQEAYMTFVEAREKNTRSTTSVARSDFLSEEEKSAVVEILSTQEEKDFTEFYIDVYQTYTEILFMQFAGFWGDRADMFIINQIDSNTQDSDIFYQEQISNEWYIKIDYENGA